MWRAVRLVVDTGMHSQGWTREQAIQFFKDNTGKTDQDITVEVDRYIVWPGQALAYKLGQLKIRELRTEAEKRARREIQRTGVPRCGAGKWRGAAERVDHAHGRMDGGQGEFIKLTP